MQTMTKSACVYCWHVTCSKFFLLALRGEIAGENNLMRAHELRACVCGVCVCGLYACRRPRHQAKQVIADFRKECAVCKTQNVIHHSHYATHTHTITLVTGLTFGGQGHSRSRLVGVEETEGEMDGCHTAKKQQKILFSFPAADADRFSFSAFLSFLQVSCAILGWVV